MKKNNKNIDLDFFSRDVLKGLSIYLESVDVPKRQEARSNDFNVCILNKRLITERKKKASFLRLGFSSVNQYLSVYLSVSPSLYISFLCIIISCGTLVNSLYCRGEGRFLSCYNL